MKLRNPFKKHKDEGQDERGRLRPDLTEKQLDKIIEDSFPASDPPANY